MQLYNKSGHMMVGVVVAVVKVEGMIDREG